MIVAVVLRALLLRPAVPASLARFVDRFSNGGPLLGPCLRSGESSFDLKLTLGYPTSLVEVFQPAILR